MKRQELERVLRAASQIAQESDILVIGSQSILGAILEDRLPAAATASIEVDVAFFDDPDDAKADRVDGAIGELSPFHETFGYYAQGVSVSTAVLPAGWRQRLDEAGREGVAVALHEVQGTRTELIFDRASHAYLGTRTVALRDGDGLTAGQVLYSGAVLTVRIADRVGA